MRAYALLLIGLLYADQVCAFGLPRRLVHQEEHFMDLPQTIERRGHKAGKVKAQKPLLHTPPHHTTVKTSTKVFRTSHTTKGKGAHTTSKPQATRTTKSRTTSSKSTHHATSSAKVTLGAAKSHSVPLPSTVVRTSTQTHASSTHIIKTTSKHQAGCPTISGGINSLSSTPGAAVTTVAKTADGPAPTRSAVACTPPPSGFGGTSDGFEKLCAGVRYCDPPKTNAMQWAGPNGDVTRNEIETLLGDLQDVGTHYTNGQDNALSDGWLGLASYGAGLLWEITGDRRALDVAVRIADNMLATRNDPVTGRVMWTGKREPIWPTKPEGKNTATYYGCESMHVVGHMVNVAIYILKTPCLWNLKPQMTSAPTVFNSTSTYLDRALAYVAAGDQTTQQSYMPYYLNSNSQLINPANPLYAHAHDFPPGVWQPWNRRVMFLHGFMRLATAFGLSPVSNPARQAVYENILNVNMQDFVSALNSTTSRGYPTYVWTYARVPPGGSIEMVRGIHAFYDIWGAWIAWQHGTAPNAVTDQLMQNLANTMQHQIYSEDSSELFAAYVSGESNPCDPKEAPIRNLWGAWSYYGKFLPQWYQTMAAADAGQMAATWTSSTMLWAKAAMHRNSDAFWKGQYTTDVMPPQYIG